jgi:predicted Zn-dependent protease
MRLAAPLALSFLCAFLVSTTGEAKQSAYHFVANEQRMPKGTEVSNNDYLSEIAADGLNHWSPERFPLRVFFEPGEGVTNYEQDFRKILANSLDRWCAVSEGALSWQEVTDKNQSDLVCRWTNLASEREQGTEAGRTRLYLTLDTITNRGVIKHATMDLLTAPSDRLFTPEEIQKAYLHECGHAFGLSGHSGHSSDIMAAVITRSQPAALSMRDIASIRHLYAEYRRTAQSVRTNPNTASTQSSAIVRKESNSWRRENHAIIDFNRD